MKTQQRLLDQQREYYWRNRLGICQKKTEFNRARYGVDPEYTERARASKRKWQSRNKAYHRAYCQEWYARHRDETKQEARQIDQAINRVFNTSIAFYRQLYKRAPLTLEEKWERRRAHETKKRKTDLHYKLKQIIKASMHKALRGIRKWDRTEFYNGCTIAQLKEWFEGQFTRGMTWENYGTYWHIHHKRPVKDFDLTKEDQLMACFHYTNLMPLKAKTNMQMGARVGQVQHEFLLPYA